MPHVVIEYSEDLEKTVVISELIELARQAAAASDVMDPRDLKLRAIPYRHYRLADGGHLFVHATVRLLAGRTPAQKLTLSTLLRERLTAKLTHVHSVSVEIVDMDPDSYLKRLLPQE